MICHDRIFWSASDPVRENCHKTPQRGRCGSKSGHNWSAGDLARENAYFFSSKPPLHLSLARITSKCE